MTDPPPSAKTPSRLARLRRRLSGAAALGAVLIVVGVGYTAAASAGTPGGARAATQPQDSVEVRKGRHLYEEGCITCHGMILQGVQNRGPSLIGVGQAAVYFQVITGRMPVARQEAQASRKQPKYTPEEV